jgi:AsmA-like C-terminal region/AsmA family
MMKKSQKIVFAAALVIGLLFILPFLIPMQTYLHKTEQIASEKLGQPVTIGAAHVMLLPSPRVSASDIVVGNHDELKVANLVVIPTIGTLFSDVKILDLSISKPVVKKAALDFVAALKTSGAAASSVNIRHIKIDDLQLLWPNKKLPILNAEATLSSDNKLESATVKTADGKLSANVTPDGDEQLILVSASKWTLPAGLPLLIDKAVVEMHLNGSRLTMPKIDVALYGGKLKGDAAVSWAESKSKPNWKLTGSFSVDKLSTQEPSRMVSRVVYLSGSLFGKGNFSSAAKDAGALADNLQTNVQFKVNDGVLHGLDLVRVASLLLKQNQGGGETQFDAFSGVLSVSGKQYQLRDLNIRSGLLAATGQVKVRPSKALDGVVEVEVKSGMGMAAIPLNVSGTVDHPVLLPTKAALAGAVAGTAILGPGVGTSLGVKAAGAVDKLKGLFGGK